ncbi:MAG: hypothetical protein HFI37_00520 [Lachnospiraceae bacterium]|nr:hypothetical protein [Lachnospiraceae bacterium]
MKQKTYRICLLSMIIIALAVGIYFYHHMEKQSVDRSGALLVMEENYG